MGATKMNLTQLELNHPEEITLKLTDPARPFKDLGEIKIVVTLMPKTQEDKEQVCVEVKLYFSSSYSFIPSSFFLLNNMKTRKLSMFGM
jgi:hypothetical protein